MTRAEIETRVERFTAALKDAGIRQTQQRIEILREVLTSEDHPDVEWVFKRVKKRLPAVSLDTVYRTLWMATDLGFLTTVGPREAKLRFDSNPTPHHHFVCTRCGALFDFESPAFDELPVPRAVGELGTVETRRVELRGTCARCARRREGR